MREMFEKGAYVVYPGHGVGIIEDVKDIKVNGEDQKAYVLRPLKSKTTLIIPVKSARAVGMREVIKSSEADQILELLSKEEEFNNNNLSQPWNQRFRQYTERLNSGSAFEVAKVLNELHLLRNYKKLSFGEKKLMETALRLLAQELAVAKQAEEQEIRKEIQERLP
ncbi:MAG: CarD family transcriptional regulator [Deltaproteobacteria bacterium]|nr:MAG: CarD family transcriptional regulator [Deltaproteobacteria bacterium]